MLLRLKKDFCMKLTRQMDQKTFEFIHLETSKRVNLKLGTSFFIRKSLKFIEQLWTLVYLCKKIIMAQCKNSQEYYRSWNWTKCEKGDFEESWLSIDLVSPKPFLDWGLWILNSLGLLWYNITLANIAIKSSQIFGQDGSSWEFKFKCDKLN